MYKSSSEGVFGADLINRKMYKYRTNPYKKTYTRSRAATASLIQRQWRRKYTSKGPIKKRLVSRAYPGPTERTLQCGYNWGADFTYINSPFVYQIVFPRATVDTTNTCITNISRTSDLIYVSGIKIFLKLWHSGFRRTHFDVAILECLSMDTDYNNYELNFFKDPYVNNSNDINFPLSPTTYDTTIMTRSINTEKYNILARKKFWIEPRMMPVYNAPGTVQSYSEYNYGDTIKQLNMWIPIKRNVEFYNGQGFYPRRNFLLVWWPTAADDLDFTYQQTNARAFKMDLQSIVYFRNK